MRLIDADMLKAEFTGNFQEEYGIAQIKAMIDVMPTIEIEPVKHWKWKHFGSGLNMPLYCSRCEKTFPEYFKKFEFCPHCGARMDGKDDE